MSELPKFQGSHLLTVGIELELQLINLKTFNLNMEAKDFLRRLQDNPISKQIKPEITQAMIELNSSIHPNYLSLLSELRNIRNILVTEADKAGFGICGSGTHPFQKWEKQRIFNTPRFSNLSEEYGYLAKQFTVFGQHIHVSCPNGDDALYLCHAMVRYFPHFIALAAASPFSQGVDTVFDCSRLTIISAFPLSGTPPWVLTWKEFETYFKKMTRLKIISSIKDFYWDIRPKPEYQTIEIRVCDTPLTMEKAAALAAYAQTLIHWLLKNRPTISREIYTSYLFNRFRAARYGLQAITVDPISETEKPLYLDILETCDLLEESAIALNNTEALKQIKISASLQENDATWLRSRYQKLNSLADVVREQYEIWRNSY